MKKPENPQPKQGAHISIASMMVTVEGGSFCVGDLRLTIDDQQDFLTSMRELFAAPKKDADQ